MPAAKHERVQALSKGRGGNSSSEESESGGRTPSPPQDRKFLRSYASSSSLPRVNGFENVEDDGELGPLTSSIRGRSTANQSLNSSSSSRRFIARPMQRRSSSSETISPRHYANYSSSTAFQPNPRLVRDEPPTRNQLYSSSHFNIQRHSLGTNGGAPARPSYVSRPLNGASFASHQASSSAPLPGHLPPPYDMACANGANQASNSRRNSLIDIPDVHLNGVPTLQHGPSGFPEAESYHSEALRTSRVSRRRKGKDRSIDNLTDEYSSSSSSAVATSSTARVHDSRPPRFSLNWRRKVHGRGHSGETETETDDTRPRSRRHFHLGISERWRRANSNGPLSPLGRAAHDHDPDDDPSLKFTIDLNKLAPFLFQFTRLLSVVPAFFGIVFCICQLFIFDSEEFMDEFWTCTGETCRGPPMPTKVDWIVAGLWALLTAYHCLGLTTGLLMRWKLYYSPLATLVRLLGLQGICWPATHLTLSILGGVRRPVIAWAVIGTTTAVSRSIQIWVTSNIIWIKDKAAGSPVTADEEESEEKQNSARVFFNRLASIIGGDDSMWADGSASGAGQAYRRRERRWNWKKVGLRCLLPTGFVYVVMAWAEVAQREWEMQYVGTRR